MSSNLEHYRRRRDFSRTAEPRGGGRSGANGGLLFVVQRHHARRLHYDLRLEHDGVLKSWAVPKEPSYEPGQRRLAVQTEDHPLEYGNFEGEISEHQYGAGSVVIWDRGSWTPLHDPGRGLDEGKLDFELHGERLRGRWTLVRMAVRSATNRAKDNWLLIKRSDRPSTEDEAQDLGTVRTRSSAADASPGVSDVSSALGTTLRADAAPGAKRGQLDEEPRPQLATASTRAPDGMDWLHEPKLDGYRILCRVRDGRATILTRRGKDWTHRFSEIALAAGSLPCRAALLDGEAVVFDQHGVSDFQRLQNAIAANQTAIVMVAFDLIHLDGWDFHDVALIERKQLLRQLLNGAAQALRYGDHVVGYGGAFFEQACKLGLEGIVSKRKGDGYREQRTKSWLKVKCVQRQEFVIVGFTDPSGSRAGLGALLLGCREKGGGELRYAGKVGTGFDARSLGSLRAALEPLEQASPALDAKAVRGVEGVHWVKPRLVAEIAFKEWTADGRLRHATFKGLREDKPAAEVTVERPLQVDEGQSKPTPNHAAVAPVKFSHPERVLFPDPGITKRELAEYWTRVAEFALPLMRQRPLTLRRCPQGYAGPCFYQKHVGAGVPKVVPRVGVDEGADPYAMVDSLEALHGLVQIGVLEMHVWGSRAEHLDQPDIIVFDLDPAEELPWRAVADAALDLKQRLEALGLVPFARLTGGKGLHLVVPVVPGPGWPAVKRFSRALVDQMVVADPKRFTASVSKTKRHGKIFVDYLRNDRESTAIACYSTRARPGAPVAMPIEWGELDGNAKTPPRFLLRDVSEHLAHRSRDPWMDFEAARRPLVE